MTDWQSIETAPKDGAFWVATIYAGYGTGGMEPVRPANRRGRYRNIYTDALIDWVPTLWMPLPSPPDTGTGGGA